MFSSGFCPILRNNQKLQAKFEWFDGPIEFPGNGRHGISEKAREHRLIQTFEDETEDSSHGFEHASMNSHHGKKRTNLSKGARPKSEDVSPGVPLADQTAL
jgi:hypothetical protein